MAVSTRLGSLTDRRLTEVELTLQYKCGTSEGIHFETTPGAATYFSPN